MDDLSKNFEKVMEALTELVNASGPWPVKKNGLVVWAAQNNCDGDLDEFLSWWDQGESAE